MRDYFDHILLRTNTTKNGGQKSAMMLFIALCLRFYCTSTVTLYIGLPL